MDGSDTLATLMQVLIRDTYSSVWDEVTEQEISITMRSYTISENTKETRFEGKQNLNFQAKGNIELGRAPNMLKLFYKCTYIAL